MRIRLLLFITIALLSCSQVGKSLPEFEYQSLDGQVMNNASLDSKIVVINVWATWCGTCLEEIPELNRLVDKYKEHDEVIFLAFSDEPYGVVKPLLDRYAFNYIQFTMAQEFTDAIQSRLVKTYPQNLVVGQNGEIVFDVSDGSEDIYRALDQQISDLLTL